MSQCASCDFWAPNNGTDRVDTWSVGLCRRHAPVVIISQGQGGLWPVTTATQGCGDYERHPTRRLAE